MKTRVLRMLRRFPNVPRLRVWPGRLSHLPPWIVLAVLATAGVAAVVLVPPLIAPEVADPQAQLEVLDRARLTVALIFGGFVALLGVYMNWRRVNALERQVATAQLGQITERFTRAIDQLGAVRPDNTPVPEIRAGGVRSLERIAGESPEDLWPILDILSAYLRSESPAPPVEIDGDDLEQFEERAYGIRNRMDVAFAIDPIGRLWPRDRERVPTPLNLASVFAPRIALPAKNFRGANLGSAHLERADLEDADLRRADLVGARLEGASLWGRGTCGCETSAAQNSSARNLLVQASRGQNSWAHTSREQIFGLRTSAVPTSGARTFAAPISKARTSEARIFGAPTSAR